MNNKIIFGVCYKMSQNQNIDIVSIRLLFIILFLFNPLLSLSIYTILSIIFKD
jgi:phage shock protein PspC (stress-responsive transcriptional regulator)